LFFYFIIFVCFLFRALCLCQWSEGKGNPFPCIFITAIDKMGINYYNMFYKDNCALRRFKA